jgi:hypothetical protein
MVLLVYSYGLRVSAAGLIACRLTRRQNPRLAFNPEGGAGGCSWGSYSHFYHIRLGCWNLRSVNSLQISTPWPGHFPTVRKHAISGNLLRRRSRGPLVHSLPPAILLLRRVIRRLADVVLGTHALHRPISNFPGSGHSHVPNRGLHECARPFSPV